MRHKVAGHKLGRSKDHRKALIKYLVKQLYQHESIITTRAKAEIARRQAEKLITLAKRGNAAADEDAAKDVHARRIVMSRLVDKEVVTKLFDEIAPRYQDRPGGYTRLLKLGPRKGDGAEMVLLELVE